LRRFFQTTRWLALLAAGSLAAQVPGVHEINLYGLRKVTPEAVRRASRLQSGEPLPPSKIDMEERIAAVPGVRSARVEAVCCQGKDVTAFVGIEETSGPHVVFHPLPFGSATLPQELIAAYQQFLAALRQRTRLGKGESRPPRDPVMVEIEEKFTSFATEHLAELRTALHDDSDDAERAAAAVVIGYVPDKAAIVEDLVYAAHDPDESVRSNAIRSLDAVAIVGAGDPAQGIRIEPSAMIDLLHSIVLSDRLETVDLFVTLTDVRNQEALAVLRVRTLRTLIEMARWESLRYALRPFLLVGRVAGVPEQEIQQRWSNGEREQVIRKAVAVLRTIAPAQPAESKGAK
jgi:HEAT repeats